MSLPDFSAQFARIAALAEAAPGEDLETITQELRAAERGLRTAIGKLKIDVSVIVPKLGTVGITPAGLYVEEEGQLQVSAFVSAAFIFATYAAMPTLVDAVEAALSPTRGRAGAVLHSRA